MLDKMTASMYAAYLNLKLKLAKLEEEENGMETLETVILIAVAVVVAVLLVNILTKDGFTDDDGNKTGLVGYIFSQFKSKINAIFSSNDVR